MDGGWTNPPWYQNILTSPKNPKFQILIQIVHDDCPDCPFPQNRTFIYFKSSFSYIRMDHFIILLLADIEWLILPSSNLGQKDKKRLNYPGFIFIKSEISRTSCLLAWSPGDSFWNSSGVLLFDNCSNWLCLEFIGTWNKRQSPI